MKLDVRVALVAVALTVAAVSLVAAPAVADDDEDVGIATGDGINSTIDLEASGNHSGQSGSGLLDCEGQPTHHDCEKGGSAETDAGAVDYTGDTYGDDDDLRGGGGDEVTVASGGEQATFEFDCDLTTSPSQDDCAVNVTSSQGDAPGPLGEGDGDDGSDGGGDDGGSDAPAPQDDEVPGSAYAEAGVAEGEGLNSTLAFGYEGEREGGASHGAVDCVGQPSHHQCDKGGSLTLGPLSVDYVGDNYADDDDTRFGGGDEFIVAAGGERVLAGFDCDFDTEPSQETCDFDLGSSQADAPGALGPEDGEFDNDDDEPGDERSEEGEENGNDDGNRNGNAE